MKIKKNHLIISLAGIIALSLIIVFLSGVSSFDESNVFYFAVVGPMSGPNAVDGEDTVKGINLYLSRVNAEGGINGKRVELLVFDDQNKKDLARERALEIAEQDKALVVIGHAFSSCSIEGGEVYKKFGIPAISGSATAEAVTEGNDWYFRVIPNSHSQSVFLANYITRVLKYETTSIIYDQDAFGTSLATAFDSTFRGLGGEVKYTWSFDGKAENVDEVLDGIVSDLLRSRADDPGMIFLATHAGEAVKLTVSMRRKGLTYPVAGASALANIEFISRFNEYPEEQAKPGYFSDGIYVTTPVIFDVAGEEAQQFRNAFIKEYGHAPGMKAATNYDAVKVAVQAMRTTGVQGQQENLATERAKVRDYLASLNSSKDAVEGVTGNIYFDKQGNVVKSIAIGVYQKQYLISALTQLQLVTDLNRIADLEQELEAGRIVIVDNQYLHKTNVVYTGIDINGVSNLNIKNSSYTVDFYLWFRYQGQFQDNKIEFINSVNPLTLGEPIAEKITDDLTYRAYRVKANFKGEFAFQDYPFDQQELVVRFRHANLTRENVIYVQDLVGMRQVTTEAILDKFERAQVFSSIDDWQVIDASFFQDVARNDSTLGNPQFFDSDSDIEYSRFNASIWIKRDGLRFGVKNLFPLFIITIVSYLVFFISPKLLAVTNGLLRSALLAVAFFHLRLSNDLPGIGYTVALDYTFYIFYMLVVFALIITTFTNRANEKDNKTKVERLNLIGKAVYPIVVLGSIMALSYRYDIIILPSSGSAPADTTPTPESLTTQGAGDAEATEEVILTLGSWRVNDAEQMDRILAAFNANHPNVTVKFVPSANEEYESILRIQLKAGTAPDLFYLDSFSASFSQELFEAGHLVSLADLPELETTFTAAARSGWSTDDGEPYGLPLMAVSHGIYYNVDFFEQLDLEIPTTWEELLATAQSIQDAGYIPFANSASHAASTYQVFMNLAPNFIGGREGRLEYLSSNRCFNDKHAVAAFQALADIAPFVQPDQEGLTYTGSKLLFAQGESPMWMGGSWDITFFESQTPSFEWSIFAMPAPAGRPENVTFHPDFGIGLNAASKYTEEAKLFLEWLTTPEPAELLGNELPGFFPMHQKAPTLRNEHANVFLALNEGRGTDARWAWPKLRDGLPDGYSLMRDSVLAVLADEMTPQEAADAVQRGLAQWFEPAQNCSH